MKNTRNGLPPMAKSCAGSIEAGAKRGEAVVQAVAHETGAAQSQDYYNGRKASEVGTVRQLIEENGLLGQKTSLDALHCKPKTLEPIVSEKRIYLVGLKRNQKELFNQMSEASQALLLKYTMESRDQDRGKNLDQKLPSV